MDCRLYAVREADGAIVQKGTGEVDRAVKLKVDVDGWGALASHVVLSGYKLEGPGTLQLTEAEVGRARENLDDVRVWGRPAPGAGGVLAFRGGRVRPGVALLWREAAPEALAALERPMLAFFRYRGPGDPQMARRSPRAAPETAPYVRGSDTSEEAAKSLLGHLGPMEERVFEHVLSRGPQGATDDEVELALDLPHQTASARRRALAQRRLVVDSGQRRPTRRGRKAVVWIAAEHA